MRKHRKWWMGFGLGIVVGASLLQLILAAQDLQNGTDPSKIYTQAELDEAVEKAVQDALKRAGADAAASGNTAAGSPSVGDEAGAAAPAASPSVEPPLPASEVQAADADKVVSFYVNPGMSLTSVARSLKRLGIIEDAEDFMDEARVIARNIQPGTSVFTGQPTYEEIMAELTRKKDD